MQQQNSCRSSPKNTYVLAFLAALLGSVILEGIHYIRQVDQRRDIRTLIIAILLAFVPIIALGIFVITNSIPGLAPLGIFAFPIMPLAYFYVIFRRQLGGMEVRINRFISLYAFLILFGTALLLLITPFTNLDLSRETVILFGILALLTAAYLVIVAFPPFEAFVNQRFLGIKVPLSKLAGSLFCTNYNKYIHFELDATP